ncbi:MAG: M23 family metallopeptidase [Nannocystaceae bacterium]|nr:M23 family metallopeptidase [Nannocystaceae bacterium]
MPSAWDPDEGDSSGVLDGGEGAPQGESSGAPGTSGGAATGASHGDDDGSSGEAMPMPDVPPADDCPRLQVQVAAGAELNVRPDASTAGEPVGALPNGAIADKLSQADGEVIEGDATWFEIQWNDVHGWISGAYATCTVEQPPQLQPPDGFYIPLECGYQTTIAQGNDGTYSHQGAAFYAFDFSVPIETPLVAMADGIVIHTYAETMPGDPCYDGGGPECFAYGNLVVLLHGDGTTTLYKHLNVVLATDGEFVPRGQAVGLSGSTGFSTGPHAHIMRMEDCGMAQCQSIPLEFVEAGVPVTGQSVTSENCP